MTTIDRWHSLAAAGPLGDGAATRLMARQDKMIVMLFEVLGVGDAWQPLCPETRMRPVSAHSGSGVHAVETRWKGRSPPS